MNPRSPQSRYGLLLSIFILSGFAGLIYQSIWTHYLGLFLGHAAYAQSLVLALFMGGMAAGAILVARFGERWRNLVRKYALVEAVIGILALLFHLVFVWALNLSYDQIMPALGAPWLVNAWKWTLASALILPQTILLGMTFPLMSGGIIRRWPNQDGEALGGLYFTNSLGAAIGALVAAFVLLPSFGLPGAMVAGGILNLLVAALAWWLGSGSETPRISTKKITSVRSASSRKLLHIVLAATFFSSAASFAYEMIFVRLLSLAVGSTLHAFELMLASFIAGIAFGALWIRKRANQTDAPLRWAAFMQIFMGLAALLSLALYSSSFSWVGFLMEALSRTDGGYALFNLGTALTSMLIMVPSAFFAGTTLPLFTVALLDDGQGEASIGRVYAFNTAGAIIGVFTVVHFMIPALGLKLSLILSALVDMGIGVALLRWLVESRRDRALAGISVAGVLLACLTASSLITLDPMKMAAGVYRTGVPNLSADTEKILFHADGKTASISVFVQNGRLLVISTNGKPDATWNMQSNTKPTPDEPTMVLLGSLPFAYIQTPSKAGVIGFGSGMTTHTLLASRQLERVDTIEIERKMVEGAQWFGERVARAYEDPRSRIVFDDAKSYFAGLDETYSMIISEPSNPWISGVGAVFSKEFYARVPDYLDEDGIFIQWLQLYEINEPLVGSVLNALLPEFTDVHAYLTNAADVLLVASKTKLPVPDFNALATGDFQNELGHIGIDEGSQLAFRQIADRRLLDALARLYANRANSDYFPMLSLFAPKERFKNSAALRLINLSYLDLPVLEWLGIRAAPSADQHFPEYGHSPADSLANSARVLKRSLVDRDFSGLEAQNESLQEWVAGFASVYEVCAWESDKLEGAWMVRRLKQLMEWTLPYLDADGLHGLLIDPVWLDCDTLPAGIANALDLVAASARRDAAEMEQLGRAWLKSMAAHPEYLAELNEVAFASLQFGLVLQERFDEAAAVEEEFGVLVEPRGDYGFARSLVLAWLDSNG